jgi:hypothetical protein
MVARVDGQQVGEIARWAADVASLPAGDHSESCWRRRVGLALRSKAAFRVGVIRQYRTGFETGGAATDEPSGPFRGAGWTAELVPENREFNRIVGGMDIVLHAGAWPAAQRALDLINGCRQLVNGNPDLVPIHPIAYNDEEPEWMDDAERPSLAERLMSQEWLPTACAVAAKASRRRRCVYAIAKYKFSLELYSVHHMDLQPSYHISHTVSAHPDDHVLFSHAISLPSAPSRTWG